MHEILLTQNSILLIACTDAPCCQPSAPAPPRSWVLVARRPSGRREEEACLMRRRHRAPRRQRTRTECRATKNRFCSFAFLWVLYLRGTGQRIFHRHGSQARRRQIPREGRRYQRPSGTERCRRDPVTLPWTPAISCLPLPVIL
jgi:hypothetical protein